MTGQFTVVILMNAACLRWHASRRILPEWIHDNVAYSYCVASLVILIPRETLSIILSSDRPCFAGHIVNKLGDMVDAYSLSSVGGNSRYMEQWLVFFTGLDDRADWVRSGKSWERLAQDSQVRTSIPNACSAFIDHRWTIDLDMDVAPVQSQGVCWLIIS
jgi:hypothetical protein